MSQPFPYVSIAAVPQASKMTPASSSPILKTPMFFILYQPADGKVRVKTAPIFSEIKKIQNTKVSNIDNFFTGLFMNILNPKVYFFFFTFFPAFLFLDPIELNYLSQFYVLGLLFMLITLIVFTSIVFFSSYISKYLLKFKFFQIFMRWIQILIFLSIACLILFSV